MSATGAPVLTGKTRPKPLHVEIDERTDPAELGRVVHEHVEAAQIAGSADQPTAHRRVGDIPGHGYDPGSSRAERLGRAPSGSAFLAPTTRSYPRPASTLAMTSPRPRLAPVTIASSIPLPAPSRRTSHVPQDRSDFKCT